MRKRSFAILGSAALMLSLSMASAVLADEASGSAKPRTTGSTKPGLGSGPSEEKSLPSSAPAPTTTATTGATDQGAAVKTMNSNEKAKVETQGK